MKKRMLRLASLCLFPIFFTGCGADGVKPWESKTVSTKSYDDGAVEVQEKEDKSINIVINDVLFDFNKTKLKSKAKKSLNRIVGIIDENPKTSVVVTGHSDNVGPSWAKQKVSAGRASVVASYLKKHLKVAHKVTHSGKSDTQPRVPNTSRKNRKKNRRVEIRVTNQ